MDYRIIVKTQASGRKWYYVQKRFLIYFWESYGSGYDTLEGAEQHIQYIVNDKYAQSQKRIVKSEVYKIFNI